jgi:hypothetical protein
VYLFSTDATSVQTIDGVFYISSSGNSNSYTSVGVTLNKNCYGVLTINGIFTIYAYTNHADEYASSAFAIGVEIGVWYGGDPCPVGANIIINGFFTIVSNFDPHIMTASSCSYGIMCDSSLFTGTLQINGIFNLNGSSGGQYSSSGAWALEALQYEEEPLPNVTFGLNNMFVIVSRSTSPIQCILNNQTIKMNVFNLTSTMDDKYTNCCYHVQDQNINLTYKFFEQSKHGSFQTFGIGYYDAVSVNDNIYQDDTKAEIRNRLNDYITSHNFSLGVKT